MDPLTQSSPYPPSPIPAPTSSPPSHADAFALSTSAPPPPSPSDPRVSLRPSSELPEGASEEPQTLSAFHASEGPVRRLSRLRSLFESIPIPPPSPTASTSALPAAEEEEKDEERRREESRRVYARELWGKCSGASNALCLTEGKDPKGAAAAKAVRWTAFEKYAEEKEKELWRLFVELDVDGDMRLRKPEVREACKRAGVEIKERTLDDFIRAVNKNGDGAISFDEWRDFLLLLPRRASMSEIFNYYQTHRINRPSMSQLTQDGDVVVGRGKTGWNKLLGKSALASNAKAAELAEVEKATNLRKMEEGNDERKWALEAERNRLAIEGKRKGKGRAMGDVDGEAGVEGESEEHDEEEEHEGATHGMFAGAGKFLLAGGLAGAVSRSATAPFDRLKVYLITSPSHPAPPPIPPPSGSNAKPKMPRRNAGSIPAAVRALWRQGGVATFWTGNGLNVVKIFPESAIKFLSYESAKRVLAEYVDDVPDQTMISNSSRFLAGGIGGVVSQLFIYPIETLKTRVMSSTGGQLQGNVLIAKTAADMWRTGGIRLYFKGLTAGLIGVFPYSAIDMSTFEGIKVAYKKWSGHEPGIAGSLAFGAFSGGIGATSVYPLNLIRTRLQAQGTIAHPQVYSGVRDAATKCFRREGWRGFYKGLTPTLVKVVPAVAISWTVYDASKKVLFGKEDPETLHDHDAEEE